jgi:hypothetical protein
MGAFIDGLGKSTRAGRWMLFLTLTYRTPTFPWARGFPMAQSQPHTDFVRNFIKHAIRHLEKELCERVEYFQAEQSGSIGGRIHQHMGLSARALEKPARDLAEILAAEKHGLPESLKPMQAFLWDKAGFNRILPWESDAGYYIGRYVGRDAGRCNWDWRVGDEHLPDPRAAASIGRNVIAPSPDLPSKDYRNILRRRHR